MSKSIIPLSGADLVNKALGYRATTPWLAKRSKSHQHQVARTLYHFEHQTGMNPDQLIKYAQTHNKRDTDDLIREETKKMSEHQPQQEQNYYQLRGVLSRNGEPMPKTDLEYQPKEHREYKKEEIRKLLEYLQNKTHKLYVYIASESGLRAQTILELRNRHIQRDLDENNQPIAIRLESAFYKGKKRAGKTFLGAQTIAILKDCQANKLIGTQPDDKLIPLAYPTIHQVLRRAIKNANLDPTIQPSHGIRKYFENALDRAGMDHEIKMRIEGHSANTRPKAYTTNDFDELRKPYLEAYPHINIDDPTDTKIAKSIDTANDEIAQLKASLANLTEKYNQLLTFIPELQAKFFPPKTIQKINQQPSKDQALEQAFKSLPPTGLPIEALKRAYYQIEQNLTHQEIAQIQQTGTFPLTAINKIVQSITTNPDLT